MKSLIKFELIKRMRNPVFKVALIIVLVVIVININEASRLRASRPFGNYRESLTTRQYDFLGIQFHHRRDQFPKASASYDLLSDVYKQIEWAAHEDDYVEYTRLKSFSLLLLYKMSGLGFSPESEALVQNHLEDLWEIVGGNIPYETVDFRPFSNPGITSINAMYMNSVFYGDLYQRGLRPLYIDENNLVTISYRYFDNIMPWLLLFFVLIFNYNSINQEKEDGSLKLLLTQSISRKRIYLSKWVAGIVQLSLVLIVPILLVSVLAVLITGALPLDYPMPYLSNLTRLSPIANYSNTSVSGMPARITELGVGHVATSMPMVNDFVYHSDVSFISFVGYMLIVIVLMVVYIGFMVSLVQLISTLINQVQFSLLAALLVILGLILISLPLRYGDRLNFSPVIMFRATRIIEGIYNVTPLMATIILTGSTLIFLLIGKQCFKYKEV